MVGEIWAVTLEAFFMSFFATAMSVASRVEGCIYGVRNNSNIAGIGVTKRCMSTAH